MPPRRVFSFDEVKTHMSFIELFLSAIALSMDAFAVAICKGLSQKNVKWKHGVIAGVWFGGFQALMPLIGYLIGSQFAELVAAYTHWIAFGLLVLIGANMVREALFEKEEALPDCGFAMRVMLPMAVATSIDALAVGVAFAGLSVRIVPAVLLIGVVTFAFSFAGVKIGSVFGARFEKKAQMLGGIVLILLGVKILLEHFGVL